jgi:hypothetical protein
VISSFWGSTSALEQLAALQRHGAAGSDALRRGELVNAAQRQMRTKLAAADLTAKERMTALTILLDSEAAGDEIEARGSSTEWAAGIGIDRATVSSAIARFSTLGLADILANGKRQVRWHLRWVLSADEWQVIHEHAAASVRQMLADATYESGARPNYLLKSAS